MKKEKKFWIIWNPDGERPPATRFYNKRHALLVARRMSRELKGTFYVLRTDAVAYQQLLVRYFR